MGYWVVMAIVALAVVAVLIAVGSDEEAPEPQENRSAGRSIWVAIGTNGNAPADSAATRPRHWADLVGVSLGEHVIAYDFTRAGCTADEAQQDQLAAAVATAPDVVSILLGPDDFRDAEDLGSFERRLWHILTTIRDAGGTPVLASLPDLTGLPSLAAEEDATALGEELQTWNVAIARIVAAADGELVASAGDQCGKAEELFTERGGRFILTDAGQRWFASLMEQPVRRLLGLVEKIDTPTVAHGTASPPLLTEPE